MLTAVFLICAIGWLVIQLVNFITGRNVQTVLAILTLIMAVIVVVGLIKIGT